MMDIKAKYQCQRFGTCLYEQCSTTKWIIGHILQLFTGSDQNVRYMTINTKYGYIKIIIVLTFVVIVSLLYIIV